VEEFGSDVVSLTTKSKVNRLVVNRIGPFLLYQGRMKDWGEGNMYTNMMSPKL
jgi:hypothetical protein